MCGQLLIYATTPSAKGPQLIPSDSINKAAISLAAAPVRSAMYRGISVSETAPTISCSIPLTLILSPSPSPPERAVAASTARTPAPPLVTLTSF